MAKWERYIVYPLLFVALFFGVARETRVLQAAGSIIDEIRARRVVVVDEAGREQVVLRGAEQVGEAGGQIEMFNKEGKKQVVLGATIVGGKVQMFDEKGKQGVQLGASSVLGGELMLYGPEGNLGMFLGNYIKLSNLEGKSGVSLSTSSFGGNISLKNPEGKTGVSLIASSSGGYIGLYNPEDKTGVWLEAEKDGGFVRTYNPHGDPRVSLSAY